MASSSFNSDTQTASGSLSAALDLLLQFGELMLRAGSTAIRTREWLGVAAHRMGLDDISAILALDSIVITIRRADERCTGIREVRPPNIDATKIRELERLAATIDLETPPNIIAAELARIEKTRHRFSRAFIVAAIGAASGAFAFLNGSGVLEVIAAGIGGGAGQALRSGLSRWQVSQFGVAALCAVGASGTYVLSITLAGRMGFAATPHAAGFMSSVLFLVPGFPLIASLFDLMLLQTAAALGRFAYGMMILLGVAFGLSIVIEAAAIDPSRQPPFELHYPLTLLLRAIASFVAGSAFAMLFNNTGRIVFAVGLIALVANSLRLILLDHGMMPAPAGYFGALAVGSAMLLASRDIPRVILIVPAIIIMVPGLYAFDAIALFNRGQMVEALQASASCAFIIGALAMGLATTRFLTDRRSGARSL